MKKYSVVALALLLFATAAWADDEVSAPKPIAGYDGGFVIRNPDGDFELKIKSRLQPQYFFEKGRLSQPSVNTFRMRRASIVLTGTFAKNWGFTTVLQNSSGSAQAANPIYWEAQVTYTPSPLFGLEMGIVTAPMDRIGQVSSGGLMFVNFPLSSTQSDGIQDLSISRPSFGLTTAPGIVMSGSWNDKLLYMAGATNGPNPNYAAADAQFTSNFNKRLSGGLRLQYNVLKDPGFAQSDVGWSDNAALAFGGGLGYEDQGAVDSYTSTTANPIFFRYNTQGSLDVAFKYKGLSIIGEWYGRIQSSRGVVSGNNFTLQDAGYYVLVGYFVIPRKLELALESSQVFREGPHNDSSQYFGGINWYIHKNYIKWQTNVGTMKSFDSIDGTNGDRLLQVWSMLTLNI